MGELRCDICGSTLGMNVDLQSATCTCCGIRYGIDVLKVKLKTQSNEAVNIPTVSTVPASNAMQLEQDKPQEQEFTIVSRNILVKYTGTDQHVDIPEGIVEIGDGAFQESNICSVKFPSTLEVVGECAFMDCRKLEHVQVNEKLRLIKDDAFFSCTKLRELKLNEGLQAIGSERFTFFPSDYDENRRNGLVFVGCPLETLHIPASVFYIHPNAFYKCNAKITYDGHCNVVRDAIERSPYERSKRQQAQTKKESKNAWKTVFR